MNGISAPTVPGNKEEQELKSYTITTSRRFHQYLDFAKYTKRRETHDN